MIRALGYQQTRRLTRERWDRDRKYAMAPTAPPKSVMQPIPWIRNQQDKPSCAGQAFAAIVDAAHAGTELPRASAVDLWIDARRRQGDLLDASQGVAGEFVINSLMVRGWSSYTEGEDSEPLSDDMIMPELDKELEAYDHRQLNAIHYTIPFGNRKLQVIDALSKGYGVMIGGSCKDAFFNPPHGKVLGLDYFNGDAGNGHAMRIAGYDAALDAFIDENSWGSDWDFCVTSAGLKIPGCCLFAPAVIESVWDVEVIGIVA